jgi:hypothetical protein
MKKKLEKHIIEILKIKNIRHLKFLYIVLKNSLSFESEFNLMVQLKTQLFFLTSICMPKNQFRDKAKFILINEIILDFFLF